MENWIVPPEFLAVGAVILVFGFLGFLGLKIFVAIVNAMFGGNEKE